MRPPSVAVTAALVMLWVALSPSLLPRAWWMTAANVAVAMTFGYAAGAGLGLAARALARVVELRVSIRPAVAAWLRRGWVTLLAAVSVLMWVWSLQWQLEVAQLVQWRGGSARVQQAVGVAVGLVLFLLVLLLARAIRYAGHLTERVTRHVLPRHVGRAAGVGLVLVVLGVVTADYVLKPGMEAVARQATALNAQAPPGREPPTRYERSGGWGSYEPWSSLGRQGQAVVADGPRAADIAAVTGRPALEPIRVYAGLRAGRSLQDTADAVVTELRRTGAFTRGVLVVMTPAGEGWLPSWSPAAVEFLTGGNSAIASLQYTYLPSGLAYLTDREGAAHAGRVLFQTVYEEWLTWPEDRRPRLFVAGESLGAYGGHGAFADASDMLSKVDGAVWTGTPSATPIRAALTKGRRRASPEIAPAVANGRHVRFVTRPQELFRDFDGAPYDPWRRPRIVYLQYASDPVVWWSPQLLWREPDWLRERVGRDVSDSVRWMPWVTFWQLATDLPRAIDIKDGHGHRYFDDLIPCWAAVLGQDPRADFRDVAAAIRALDRPL